MGRALLFILALLLVGAGVLYYLFSQDIAKARVPVTGRSQAIDTTFGKVEYAERGEGEAVLTIHGSGGGFDQGLDMTGTLAESYRLIAPSRFGYLGSAYPENPTIAMQADAFAELLDGLALDKVIVLGGSAGALSAMEFAIRYPDRCRALVLVVPAAYSPTRKPNTSGTEGPLMTGILKTVLGSDFIFWAGTRFFPDFMTGTVLATDPALVHAADAGEQARVRAILDHILPVSVRAQGLMFDMRTAGAPEPQAIDRIICPVLTISSDDDMFGTADPAKYIASHVANGRAVLYPTGGHVWVGHQEDVWREIRAFLDSVDGTTVTAVSPNVLQRATSSPEYSRGRPDGQALAAALAVALAAGSWFGFLRKTGIVRGRTSCPLGSARLHAPCDLAGRILAVAPPLPSSERPAIRPAGLTRIKAALCPSAKNAESSSRVDLQKRSR